MVNGTPVVGVFISADNGQNLVWVYMFLLKGLLIGLAVAVPIGPVGLMCLENTVSRGKKAGLSCASGMVLADIFSATLMLIGIGLFYDTIEAYETAFKIVTGLIFSALGAALLVMRNRPTKSVSSRDVAGLSISSFILAISPATFALMLFLFPALGLTEQARPVPVILGVALGSAAWCALILSAGKFIRNCLGDRLPVFKLVVGILFILCGIVGIIATVLG